MRRTTDALVGALVALVPEKRYDAITIQDLLDHADVGRSTFYSHFRGKDDLLLRSFERMLDALDRHLDGDRSVPDRVAPVRELFDHVGRFRRFQQALARARVLDRQFQAGVEHLSRTIERRLAARVPTTASSPIPDAVRAQALAGALFALLRWWIDNDTTYTPAQMDDMFHAMLPMEPPRGP